MRSHREYAPIVPYASKLAEHACRLAAILAAYRNPKRPQIDEETISAGAALAYYCADEQCRLTGAAAVDHNLLLAEETLSFLRAETVSTDGRFYLGVIYQYGPAEVRTKEMALSVVRILEDHGHVRQLPPNIEIGFRNDPVLARREAWELIQGV
jgi:hypothetical protein